MSRRPGTWLAATATVALLCLATSCGGSSGDDSVADASSGASSTPTASTASTASPATDTESGSTSSSIGRLTSAGIFSQLSDAQKKAGSYAFTLKTQVSTSTIRGTGVADLTRAKPASRTSIDAGGGMKLESIIVDGVFYFRGGPYGADKWLKIDPTASSGLGAIAGQFSSGDPSAALKALQGAAKVTKKGSSRVNGVDTIEYDVVVDGAALIKANPNLARVKSSLPKTVTYQLFVDGEHRLVRLANVFAVSGQKSLTTIDFSDYGKPVSIEAPPASETTTKLPAGLGGASS